MRATTTTFLRRTFVLLGAALALATGTPAMAQGKVTLTGTAGNTCDYSEMKVTPNGNIVVTCGSTVVNPSAANFALSHSSASTNYVLAPNTSSTATVTRTGGPAGEALMVTYSVSGSGCSSFGGGIMMLANSTQTIPFSVGAAGTSCLVQIGAPSGHTASPSSITFTAQSPTTPPPSGAPSDCPAIPNTSVAGSTIVNDFQGVDQRRMGSGVIAYYAVPAPRTVASVSVEFNQTAANTTPGGAVTEFQVSRCPGVFNPPGHTIAPQCTYRNSQLQLNSLRIWTAPTGPYTSQAALPWDGNCFAAASDGQYYVNVRWTYSFCPPDFTLGCGFNIRWVEYTSNSPF